MRAPSLSTHLSSALATASRFVGRLREAQERRRVVVGRASRAAPLLRALGLTRVDVDYALVPPAFNDATLVLAERAGSLRRHQRAMAREAWAALTPRDDARASSARRVA